MNSLIAVFVLVACLVGQVDAGQVRGYVRRDGTYVQPHYRTDPDNSPYNNQSRPGNWNYNTGRQTTGDQNQYDSNYYQRRNETQQNNGGWSPYQQKRQNRGSSWDSE